jgi:type IV pilus assembly protein PilW
MNLQHASRARRQRGLTLIEIMVAMAIATFLLGGLFSIVFNTKKTFLAQSAMAQLQDSERLAMTLIGDVIQQGGYFPNPLVNTASSVLPAGGVWLSAGQGLSGTTTATVPGDTLTVRFMSASGDGTINCNGGTWAGAGNQIYTNVFSIDGAGNLACQLNGGAVLPLVANVQSLKILYGVKTNFTSNNGAVDSYMTSTQMTAANWNNVIVVNVTLTFLNPLAGQPGQAATIPFQRTIAVMAQTGVRS